MHAAEPLLAVRKEALLITGAPADYEPLLGMIGDARFVLLGEASHGTHEFYAERARITKLLIEEKDFNAVVAEADWPDAYRVNRYVRALGGDSEAIEALSGFRRFPAWMWRNADVLDFIGWLRDHNDNLPRGSSKVGFYGMDLYSLHASIEAVLGYLDKVDHEAAGRARYRYGCFEDFGEDTQAYGYAAAFGLDKSCENEVIQQLVEIRARAADLAGRDGRVEPDEFFYVEQNARLVKNAERYYRSMFGGRAESWNLRDRHMAETLDALVEHVGRDRAKFVLWAHNSHLGDARATEMGDHGELNVGQLVREKYGEAAVLVGFSTSTGTVTAASAWGGPAERKQVRPALKGSYEALFHQAGVPNFLLVLRGNSNLTEALRAPRLERAIGVIYLPQSERVSHYFEARLPEQFDAIIHIDEARAVEPLERTGEWEAGELPETYPYAV
jgi:erythromycin esterase-like protein